MANYETATLLAIQDLVVNTPFLESFWTQFFPRTINFDTDKVMFDEIDTVERRLAPFVAPNVQGRPIRSKGYDTRSFRPAYVKPKHVIDPSRALTRVAGENPLGSLSQGERWDLAVADNLRREKAMIQNCWDWMGCRAIVDAAVTVVGEDYPSVTVDFRRDPSLTILLTGNAQWSNATATPMADIKEARTSAFRKSNLPITDLLFGLDAWGAFTLPNHPDVQKLLDIMFRGSASNFNTAGLSSGAPFEYMGSIGGSVDGSASVRLWTMQNQYEVTNPDGTVGYVDYFDSGTVIGFGAGAKQGTRAFGAIQDVGAKFVATDMWPKAWDQIGDPTVSYTMTQSSPLMVPGKPNNTFKMKVV